MSEINNGGLDQYGAEPSEQQQFGTAGVERVKLRDVPSARLMTLYVATVDPLYSRCRQFSRRLRSQARLEVLKIPIP